MDRISSSTDNNNTTITADSTSGAATTTNTGYSAALHDFVDEHLLDCAPAAAPEHLPDSALMVNSEPMVAAPIDIPQPNFCDDTLRRIREMSAESAEKHKKVMEACDERSKILKLKIDNCFKLVKDLPPIMDDEVRRIFADVDAMQTSLVSPPTTPSPSPRPELEVNNYNNINNEDDDYDNLSTNDKQQPEFKYINDEEDKEIKMAFENLSILLDYEPTDDTYSPVASPRPRTPTPDYSLSSTSDYNTQSEDERINVETEIACCLQYMKTVIFMLQDVDNREHINRTYYGIDRTYYAEMMQRWDSIGRHMLSNFDVDNVDKDYLITWNALFHSFNDALRVYRWEPKIDIYMTEKLRKTVEMVWIFDRCNTHGRNVMYDTIYHDLLCILAGEYDGNPIRQYLLNEAARAENMVKSGGKVEPPSPKQQPLIMPSSSGETHASLITTSCRCTTARPSTSGGLRSGSQSPPRVGRVGKKKSTTKARKQHLKL